MIGLALCISLLMGVVSGGSSEDVSAQRAALIRYLASSRTIVVVRHFFVPLKIREIAVDRWGFDGMNSDDVRAIESYVDRPGLEAAVVALHARHVTAADADEVAQFSETEVGQRLVRHTIGMFLPSSDPLSRQRDEPVSPQDEARFKTFFSMPAARRLKAVERQLTSEIQTLVADAADAAIAAYVRARGLPHMRRDHVSPPASPHRAEFRREGAIDRSVGTLTPRLFGDRSPRSMA